MDESLPEKVLRLFKDFLAGPPPTGPRPRLDHLPFSLHLLSGASAVELFPAGPLDVLRFHQRHHDSLHHDLEYVMCVPEGAPSEDFRAHAVVRLKDDARLPLADLAELERKLQSSYGTLIHLPRARPLFERQYSRDLNDEDPPEGLNRVLVPEGEPQVGGRLTVAEILAIVRKELPGPDVVSWLEGAFRQPPPPGVAEHRYYLDGTAQLYLVRHHAEEGKSLHRADTSAEALRPEKRRRR